MVDIFASASIRMTDYETSLYESTFHRRVTHWNVVYFYDSILDKCFVSAIAVNENIERSFDYYRDSDILIHRGSYQAFIEAVKHATQGTMYALFKEEAV